jgi:hypothetical protein
LINGVNRAVADEEQHGAVLRKALQ